jgi:transcriptional regulator with XRE-family HTH domain
MTDAPIPAKSPHARPAGARPNPVDVHIGKRIRLRRMLLGLSLEDLAAWVGVAFQQIQKYEAAVNRVSTSRLWALAAALNCPVAFFYEGMNADAADAAAPLSDQSIFVKSGPHDLKSNFESLTLVRAYWTIKNRTTRRHIFELATSLGKAADSAA